MTDNAALLRFTTDIVTRALAAHTMSVDELPGFISGVHNALYTAANPAPVAEEAPQKPKRGRPRKVKTQAVETEAEAEDDTPEITMGEDGEYTVPKRPEPMFVD